VPHIKYFNYISLSEYNKYISTYTGKWSLREETLKYCDSDVRCLWQIIRKFQVGIFNKFEVDVNNYPTLSSLAFTIYRVKYLKEDTIPCITGALYNELKESYTGGSVDVYKPIGENINRYDVNSLYPSVMSKFPSPTGKIKRFKGNILKYNSDAFGFFNVKIITPKNLKTPILQTRIKTPKGGIMTVAPLGEWTGWYFSEELKNAISYGYSFEVIHGYTFEKEFIFKEYVAELYNMKKNSLKDTPNYIISKLLLNGLYGRFGMNPDKENNIILKGSENIGKFLSENLVTDITSLGDDDEIELMSYKSNKEGIDNDIICYSGNNISVVISSSITAYARIMMSKIKIDYQDHLYYSDTDSIDLDIELPLKYISDELGDFKHENTFKKALYLAPKVYCGVTEKDIEYLKIKGAETKSNEGFIKIKSVKQRVLYNDLEKVLIKGNKHSIQQEKWYKNISEGKITTKKQEYKLVLTENKRKLIFKDNKLYNTIPYRLKDGKLE
jgi:hypothetical protein